MNILNDILSLKDSSKTIQEVLGREPKYPPPHETEYVTVPQLSNRLETVRVVKVHFSEGESVTKDDTILELESDKVILEMHTRDNGVLSELHVKEGDVVSEYEWLATVTVK